MALVLLHVAQNAGPPLDLRVLYRMVSAAAATVLVFVPTVCAKMAAAGLLPEFCAGVCASLENGASKMKQLMLTTSSCYEKLSEQGARSSEQLETLLKRTSLSPPRIIAFVEHCTTTLAWAQSVRELGCAAPQVAFMRTHSLPHACVLMPRIDTLLPCGGSAGGAALEYEAKIDAAEAAVFRGAKALLGPHTPRWPAWQAVSGLLIERAPRIGHLAPDLLDKGVSAQACLCHGHHGMVLAVGTARWARISMGLACSTDKTLPLDFLETLEELAGPLDLGINHVESIHQAITREHPTLQQEGDLGAELAESCRLALLLLAHSAAMGSNEMATGKPKRASEAEFEHKLERACKVFTRCEMLASRVAKSIRVVVGQLQSERQDADAMGTTFRAEPRAWVGVGAIHDAAVHAAVECAQQRRKQERAALRCPEHKPEPSFSQATDALCHAITLSCDQFEAAGLTDDSGNELHRRLAELAILNAEHVARLLGTTRAEELRSTGLNAAIGIHTLRTHLAAALPMPPAAADRCGQAGGQGCALTALLAWWLRIIPPANAHGSQHAPPRGPSQGSGSKVFGGSPVSARGADSDHHARDCNKRHRGGCGRRDPT